MSPKIFFAKHFDRRRWAADASLSTLIFHEYLYRDRYLSGGEGSAIFVVFIPISSWQTQIHNSATDNQRDEALVRSAVEEHLFWGAVIARHPPLIHRQWENQKLTSAWNIYARRMSSMFEPIPRGRAKENTYKIRRESSSNINDRRKFLKGMRSPPTTLPM